MRSFRCKAYCRNLSRIFGQRQCFVKTWTIPFRWRNRSPHTSTCRAWRQSNSHERWCCTFPPTIPLPDHFVVWKKKTKDRNTNATLSRFRQQLRRFRRSSSKQQIRSREDQLDSTFVRSRENIDSFLSSSMDPVTRGVCSIQTRDKCYRTGYVVTHFF